MNKNKIFFFTSAISFFILFFVHCNSASAKVIVYDSVASRGKAVRLTAVTKGVFFPEGGILVKFYLDGKHIGTTLSGGDGYAFLKYLPHSQGVKYLKAERGVDTDEGVLLVTGKNEKVLLVEIEGTLLAPEIQDLFHPVQGGKEALQRLSERFRIVYVTTLTGVRESRKWLKENGFPLSAILKWEGADMLSELQDRKINLHAIIGSPGLISEVQGIPKRFSFRETENGVEVKDWDDLSKQLIAGDAKY